MSFIFYLYRFRYHNEEMTPVVVVLLHLHKILTFFKNSLLCIENVLSTMKNLIYNYKYFHDKTS